MSCNSSITKLFALIISLVVIVLASMLLVAEKITPEMWMTIVGAVVAYWFASKSYEKYKISKLKARKKEEK